MINKVKLYFENKKHELHFFHLLGFSEKDYATYQIISVSKKKTAGIWYGNNLIFPVVVIFLPYILTIVHNNYGTVEFNKSLTDICIAGSLSLLGINVLRTSSTIISEKLNLENIPSELAPKTEEVISEINAIKKKLSIRSWILSAIGMILYFLQIGLFVKNEGAFIFWFVVGITFVTLFSIFLGRFISLLESNIFDKEDAIRLLFRKLITQKEDYVSLEQKLNKQGLL